MKIKFISKLLTLIVVTLFVFATSCQNEDTVKPDHVAKATVEPLTDPKIIAEIQAMAAGQSISQGRTSSAAVVPPSVTLPPGFNYTTMSAVTIPGTSWVTYVAKSTTVYTPTNKEMVAMYYQDGVFKNWVYQRWQKQTIRLRDGSTEVYYHSNFTLPPDYCLGAYPPVSLHLEVAPAINFSAVERLRVYPPGQCGQSVMDCVTDFYSGHGWLSLGLTLATMVDPAVAFGAVGGCMVGCMVLGPNSYVNC